MINDVHISPEYVLAEDGEWQTDVPASLQFSDVTELRVYLNGEALDWADGYVEYDRTNDKYVAHVVNGKAGDRVVIARWCSFSQEVDLHNYQGYDREVFEGMFDKLTKMCGELKEKTDRAVLARIGISEEDFATWRAGVVEPNRLSIGTVDKGDDASASITGTAPDLTLNLVLPKGDQGEQGIQGIQGEKGDKGDANTLSIGTVTKGDTASASITGDAPNQTLNLVLPKGDTGATGATGAKGDTGDSAYQAWLNAGNTGTEADFIASLKGDKGDTGNNGSDGVSPTATVTQTATGAVVSITDKNGTTSATLSNGKDGGYTLPAATSNSLGGVKVGSNLRVTSDGTLSADVSTGMLNSISGQASQAFTTAEVAKGNLSSHTSDSTIHVPSSGTTGHVLTKTTSGNAWQELAVPDEYTLPTATGETLGGVKVDGYGIELNEDGALRIKTPSWGGIGVMSGELTVMLSSGLTTNSGSIEVAPATSSTIGGIKVGNNLSITSDGTLSASGVSAVNAYTTLTGTAVSVSPAVKPYKLTASAAVTLTASGGTAGSTGYAELVIVVGASGSITAGSNLTLVDALTASKTNYCVIRWEGTAASLFVWRTE